MAGSPTPERVRQVFAEAMQQPAEQRAAIIERACAGDAALLAEVKSFVQAMDDAAAAGFFAAPTHSKRPSATETLHTPVTEGPGTRIGPYKILQLIGEGGFGSVFMAEQSKPVERRVALKIIKLGMDTRTVIARFEAERQALAMMDHPNIARVLDAGATETGRPFFVMELVKGEPITDYCDRHNLSIDDRLELFAQVCNAVQHAHAKGIIHRDIKPSNVLVSTQDGKPYAKVIDFGIAKATAARLTEKTLFTEHKSLIGTPEYMSPEQAEGSMDIDTRTDVYALGVLLYELLTGATPFDSEKLRSAAYGEMQRIIREIDPPNPSTRLSQNTDTIGNVAARRRTEPKKLGSIVRGELDWIVMKALEKDRSRRYETANGLAADIRRYLGGEAVVAAPPSSAYRLKKFVRRNKGLVTAASVVMVTLMIGIVGTTWGLVQAERSRRIAVDEAQRAAAAATAEKHAKEDAQASEAQTKAVLDFVENRVFAAARPKGQEGGQGYEVKLADAIMAALPYVEQSFTDQPLIEARLRLTLGNSFHFLGQADVAAQQYRRARDLYAAQLGRDHPNTLTSMSNLAVSYASLGRHPEALALREETLRQRQATLGPDHPDTLMSMNDVGISYSDLGRHAEALALFEKTLELQKATLGPDHPDTLMSMNNLASSYADLGRFQEVLVLNEETLKLFKAKFGPDHPQTLRCMGNLAFYYDAAGRHSEALALGEETLKLLKARLGLDHPDTLQSMGNVATTYQLLGRYPQALALLEETLKLQKARLGPNHPDTADTTYGIACVHALMIAKAEDRGQQADLAMGWLQQAVAAGFKDVVHMKQETNLDPLREREDFKNLIAELDKRLTSQPSRRGDQP